MFFLLSHAVSYVVHKSRADRKSVNAVTVERAPFCAVLGSWQDATLPSAPEWAPWSGWIRFACSQDAGFRMGGLCQEVLAKIDDN